MNSSRFVNSFRTNIIKTTNRFRMSDSSQSKSVLLFLHGLGDQGSSWQEQLGPWLPKHIQCICPTAPIQPVTLNHGMRMNSWFDLRSLNASDPEDESGIQSASKRIHELIEDQEKQGIPTERIMLGGFSQGGALALYAAFTYPRKLAGVVALSCWLPLRHKITDIATEAAKTIPVFQGHGEHDPIVPLNWASVSKSVMSNFIDKTKYESEIYAHLGHTASPRVLKDISKFITKHLADK